MASNKNKISIKRVYYRSTYYIFVYKGKRVIERELYGKFGSTAKAKENYAQFNTIKLNYEKEINPLLDLKQISLKQKTTYKNSISSPALPRPNEKSILSEFKRSVKTEKHRKISYHVEGVVSYTIGDKKYSELIHSNSKFLNIGDNANAAKIYAWEKFNQRVSKLVLGNQSNYDSDEGIKLIENGKVKIRNVKEGWVYYVKNR